MNKLPNFLCVGAQKAGTTTLYDILKQHPEICLPVEKETHFFNKEARYLKGVTWWLKRCFSNYNNEKILGDITPEYLFFKKVPNRIFNTLGRDIKIIIIVRDPVARAYSQYLMSVTRGFEHLSFDDAIKIESTRIKDNKFNYNHFSYINRIIHYTIQ